MKKTITIAVIALVSLQSCSKKDKCYVCTIKNTSAKFGVTETKDNECGTKDEMTAYKEKNTVAPFAVVDSNGDVKYNSRTVSCD